MQKDINVCWIITTKCNKNCKFCFNSAEDETLTEKEHKQIIDRLEELGIKKIGWTGGECLLVPHLYSLIKYAHDKGIDNRICSNGILLIPDELAKYKGIVKKMNISLHSLEHETNARMGCPERHEDLILSRLDAMKSNGFYVTVNTTVTKQNINDLEKLGATLIAKNIDRWKIMQFSPFRGMAIKNRDLFQISREEFQNCITNLRAKYPELNISAKTTKDFEDFVLRVTPDGKFRITQGSDIEVCDPLNEPFNPETIHKIMQEYYSPKQA